jgi:hypothetical protein
MVKQNDAMNVIVLGTLLLVAVVGCASTDPISRFAARPPEQSTKLYTFALPPTATSEQVVREFLPADPKYQVVEVRTVHLGGRLPCTAAILILGPAGSLREQGGGVDGMFG